MLGPDELPHLHRRRLTGEGRSALAAAVGASHIVGDGCLFPRVLQALPSLTDFWKVDPKFSWGNSKLPLSLVIFPDHLTRLQDKVVWELANNADLKGVVVSATVPRKVLDEVEDWAKFSTMADSSLVSGWFSELTFSSVKIFAVLAPTLHYPAGELVVPLSKWVEGTLPLRQVMVALTVVRKHDAPSVPAFSKVGTFRSWKELQASDRAGVNRVCLEVDLLQRPQGGRDLHTFGRRALAKLAGTTPSPSAASTLPPLQSFPSVWICFVTLWMSLGLWPVSFSSPREPFGGFSPVPGWVLGTLYLLGLWQKATKWSGPVSLASATSWWQP